MSIPRLACPPWLQIAHCRTVGWTRSPSPVRLARITSIEITCRLSESPLDPSFSNDGEKVWPLYICIPWTYIRIDFAEVVFGFLDSNSGKTGFLWYAVQIDSVHCDRRDLQHLVFICLSNRRDYGKLRSRTKETRCAGCKSWHGYRRLVTKPGYVESSLRNSEITSPRR